MRNSDKSPEMKDELLRLYGPLIGGMDLQNILGYKAASTFNRAKRMNLIGVKIFEIPNRRGSFALTKDVADWLQSISSVECHPSKNAK